MSNNTNDLELRDLYDRYASLIHERCRYILHSDDDAWDATQEVFIKLMRNLPSIKNKASIYSWLLSTSTNLCFSLLRKKKGEAFDEEVHGTVETGLSYEKKAALKNIITTLFRPWNKKIREVVVYSYIYEYSQKEIAQLTGLGESTIRKYLTRFKRSALYAYDDFKEVTNG